MADCYLIVDNPASLHANETNTKTALENYGHTVTIRGISSAVATDKDVAIGSARILSTNNAKYANNANIPYVSLSRDWQNAFLGGGGVFGDIVSQNVEAATEFATAWPSGGSEGSDHTIFSGGTTIYTRTSFLPAGMHRIGRDADNTAELCCIVVPSGSTLYGGGTALSHQVGFSLHGSSTCVWTTVGETFLGELVDWASGVPAGGGGPDELTAPVDLVNSSSELPSLTVSQAKTVATNLIDSESNLFDLTVESSSTSVLNAINSATELSSLTVPTPENPYTFDDTANGDPWPSPWVSSIGSAGGIVDVQGQRGRIVTPDTADNAGRAWFGTATDHDNIEILVRIAVPDPLVDIRYGIIARADDWNDTLDSPLNGYFGQVRPGDGNVRLRRWVNGVGTTSEAPYTYTAGVDVWARFQLDGNTQRIRVWNVGDAEPSTWLITRNDTDYASGRWGIAAAAGSGLSNLTGFFDSFTVTDLDDLPSATRSVSAISSDSVLSALSFDQEITALIGQIISESVLSEAGGSTAVTGQLGPVTSGVELPGLGASTTVTAVLAALGSDSTLSALALSQAVALALSAVTSDSGLSGLGTEAVATAALAAISSDSTLSHLFTGGDRIVAVSAIVSDSALAELGVSSVVTVQLPEILSDSFLSALGIDGVSELTAQLDSILSDSELSQLTSDGIAHLSVTPVVIDSLSEPSELEGSTVAVITLTGIESVSVLPNPIGRDTTVPETGKIVSLELGQPVMVALVFNTLVVELEF